MCGKICRCGLYPVKRYCNFATTNKTKHRRATFLYLLCRARLNLQKYRLQSGGEVDYKGTVLSLKVIASTIPTKQTPGVNTVDSEYQTLPSAIQSNSRGRVMNALYHNVVCVCVW